MATNQSDATVCPSCGCGELRVFYEIADVPTYVNFLWPTRDEALRCTRGDIRLAVCRACGLISNVAFDPTRLVYREGYENSLHYSPMFQKYAEALADRLVARFDLHGKDIIEIGCGRGDFLFMLCDRGGNRGLGFDPSHTEPPNGVTDPGRVTFVKDFYSEKYADRATDFICSRHTLEHVARPGDMLEPLRRSIGDRSHTAVFFEVPNAVYTLKHQFIWDVIYEHTSYFAPVSLASAFEAARFRVDRVYAEFGGQYLCVEAFADAVPGAPRARDKELVELSHMIDAFETATKRYVEGWRRKMADLEKSGRSVVLWGAGSKGVTFLNMFRPGDMLRRVVDLNPHKHGMFVAGSGQRIVPPAELKRDRPDTVIIANPIYQDEIARMTAALGLSPEFLHL